jgi:hypothetical protein
MHEYDIVELTADHPELTPPLREGTRGVIVDLPSGSMLAAVEIEHTRKTQVVLLDAADLRVVQPTAGHEGDVTTE